MNYKRKSKNYDELTFVDDFMFCKILENNEKICKQLLELLLGVKVRKVIVTNKQKVIDPTARGKSVRLDVYLEDDSNTVYDIEMQTTKQTDIPYRSRYYQAMIDLNMIEKGTEYNKLKKSYIIFICMNDPFGMDIPAYTFQNTCKELPDLELGDQAAKIFANAACKKKNIPKALANFYEYLRTGTATDKLTNMIDKEVVEAKLHEKWKVDYMTLQMIEKQAFNDGERKLAKLMQILVEKKDMENIRLASSDENVRQKLYEKYGIDD